MTHNFINKTHYNESILFIHYFIIINSSFKWFAFPILSKLELMILVNFYNTSVSYAKGQTASSKEGTSKYVEITINGSEKIVFRPSELVASNAALIFL